MATIMTSLRSALLTTGLAALTLTSCTHAVLVRPAPSYEAYAFELPLPAAAAVFVDGEQLYREVQISSPLGEAHCEGARYPVDARDALQLSVVGTLERLLRQVEPTAAPIGREAMESRGLDAVVVVRADTFNLGLVTGTMLNFEAVAEVTLSVSVFAGDGLQVREVVFGNAVQNTRGITCESGADALGAAIEVAIENSMTELGELIANSPPLRASLSGRG